MVWMPDWPLMIFASILVVALSLVVAALIALVAGPFRANISFRQVFQGLSYSCPPLYTRAVCHTVEPLGAHAHLGRTGLVGRQRVVRCASHGRSIDLCPDKLA
jgi:hypothetical protein